MDRHLFVIFGATGDLARRKLIPALYELIAGADAWDSCRVLGVANSPLTDEAFQARATEALAAAGHPDAAEWVAGHFHYQRATEGFDALGDRIRQLEATHSMPGNRLFYLALPPSVFDDVIAGLGNAGLAEAPGWVRLVVEKPFGSDLASARELNGLIHRWFPESSVHRIDHYLGKETVRNLLVFRFANMLFESAWNRDRVKDVQVTVAEELGVEGRGRYYDEAGALRDMVQNHLTQVMSLVAMEPPATFEADAIRDEKVKALRSIARIDVDDVVRGQYDGYQDDPSVPAGSTTETFIAARIDIDNWRWKGVPFYLRTGKRLAKRTTQVIIEFRDPPVCLFDREGSCQVHANILALTLQPHEGFELLFDVKEPGERIQLRTLPLDFFYEEEFGPLPDAYTTLIRDVIEGDQTLFVRADEVEESWRLWTPIVDGRRDLPVYPYEPGTWGPAAADHLLAGHRWVIR